MGDRVPRALTLDPQLNTGEGGPGREYRARRERPLDIDVTSVVNEKDTRGYIIRANKTERRPRCQKIAGESLLIRQCWLGDSAAYPFRNFEDLLFTQFIWHSSLLYKLITVSEWRFQARLASWLHPSIYVFQLICPPYFPLLP